MRYDREDGCRAWLTYGELRAKSVSELIHTYGSCEAIYDEFRAHGGHFLKPYANEAQIDALRKHAQPEAMHEMMVCMRRLNMGILAEEDVEYPDMLRNIPEPPALLFYRGHLDCLIGRCVTIVGSRKASPNSLDAAYNVAKDLSAAGIRVVSGLAVGIDTAALEGALLGGSPAVGVLACGLDVDYPMENHALKEHIIAAGGVLLTEYAPDAHALRWHFPVRNRIMAGLSRAVLMMEGRIRSGTMTTIQHALDQGKEVFAYPGEIGTEWAEGSHQLLREGAIYFTCAHDVMEDMDWAPTPGQPPLPEEALEIPLPPLSDEQRHVRALLQQREMSFDQIAAATGYDSPTISGALTILEIMGLIKPMPGKTYKVI